MKIQELFFHPIASYRPVHEWGVSEDYFVLTPELAHFKESILKEMKLKTRKGIWISGFFGSGKSAFLDHLSQELSHKKLPYSLTHVKRPDDFQTHGAGLYLFDEAWQGFRDKELFSSRLKRLIQEKNVFLIFTSQIPMKEFPDPMLQEGFLEISLKGEMDLDVVAEFLRKGREGFDKYFPFTEAQLRLLSEVHRGLNIYGASPGRILNAPLREIIRWTKKVLMDVGDEEARLLPFHLFYPHLKDLLDQSVQSEVEISSLLQTLALTKYVPGAGMNAEKLSRLLLKEEDVIRDELLSWEEKKIVSRCRDGSYVYARHYGKVEERLKAGM